MRSNVEVEQVQRFTLSRVLGFAWRTLGIVLGIAVRLRAKASLIAQ